MNKVLTIIPVRGGSKGVPGKNIKLLGGKPLLAWTIEAALKSGSIDRLIVLTDDPVIKRVGLEYGAEVLDEPEELAGDNCKTEPAMMYAVEELEKQGYKPDFIALIQATSPLLKPEVIKNAIARVIKDGFDSCFTAFLPSGYEFKWKESEGRFVRADYPLENSPRRQELSKLYHENGAFYVTRAELFKKNKNRLGGSGARTTLIEMTPSDSLQIDGMFDFWLIEEMLKWKTRG